jgi:Mn-dependent DtxR family transcriptional regulator
MRLGHRQRQLLRLCEKAGGYVHTSGDHAESMRLGESRVSEMLDRLQDLGLVDANNRLTDLGKKVLR